MNTCFVWGCDTISTFVGCGLHESIVVIIMYESMPVLYYYMYESMPVLYYYMYESMPVLYYASVILLLLCMKVCLCYLYTWMCVQNEDVYTLYLYMQTCC